MNPESEFVHLLSCEFTEQDFNDRMGSLFVGGAGAVSYGVSRKNRQGKYVEVPKNRSDPHPYVDEYLKSQRELMVSMKPTFLSRCECFEPDMKRRYLETVVPTTKVADAKLDVSAGKSVVGEEITAKSDRDVGKSVVDEEITAKLDIIPAPVVGDQGKNTSCPSLNDEWLWMLELSPICEVEWTDEEEESMEKETEETIEKEKEESMEIKGPAAVGVADGTTNSSNINVISPEEPMMVLPHDIEEDEGEVDDDDSNRRYEDDRQDKNQEQTTQSSNLGEEVEFNKQEQDQEEDDGMDSGSAGCAANNGTEHLLVPDHMKRVEQLEVEKKNRLDSLERELAVLRSQLEVERKINQNQTKLIEGLVNHMREKSRLDEQFLAAVPYHLS
jgi:hypothetical protein